MSIPKNWSWHRKLRAWLTWATVDQACDPSPWAMGWRLIFRPDLWSKLGREMQTAIGIAKAGRAKE